MNEKVDAFLDRAPKWQKEMAELRSIALACGLTEEIKWGKPSYSYQEKNIVIIQPFKEYCALLFFKGALLENPDGILVKTGENTQAGRQVRFTELKEVSELEAVLKAFIFEAIEVEKSGKKIETIKSTVAPPPELQKKMDELPALKEAFYALTPGRQRAYIFHFSQAKQSKTREARIDKYIPQILSGKGLND